MCSSDLDKKKKKRSVGVLNLGRRFKGPVKQVSELVTPSRERDNQEGDPREEYHSTREYEEDEPDYSEEQYPPADNKYKQLEDRLNAMEI